MLAKTSLNENEATLIQNAIHQNRYDDVNTAKLQKLRNEVFELHVKALSRQIQVDLVNQVDEDVCDVDFEGEKKLFELK